MMILAMINFFYFEENIMIQKKTLLKASEQKNKIYADIIRVKK